MGSRRHLSMKPFMPKLVYFEPKALEYPLGEELKEKFERYGYGDSLYDIA